MMIYELNARLSGQRFDEISETQLATWAAAGFDWLWLMGVWVISPAGREISQQLQPDFAGSPYAIYEYEFNPELGGETAWQVLRARAQRHGLKLMVDFVPNHLAVDAPLVDAHPEYFIHSNPHLRAESAENFFIHPNGHYLAHGKDPYFAGWTDTVQLDYSHPGLRAYQINQLHRLATLADGVRCDMAMLVLRDQIKQQWFPYLDAARFTLAMPTEFWAEAVFAVKARRPDFSFLAEVYWDQESYLQQLGFDLTYNKKLYDLLSDQRSASDLAHYLQTVPFHYLQRCLHFLENHDEERAAVRFGPRTTALAVLCGAIPGVPLIHQGQMEGFQERIPVQRIRPLQQEIVSTKEWTFYQQLLPIINQPVLRQGEMIVANAQDNKLLWRRQHCGEVAIIAVAVDGHPHNSEIILTEELLGLWQQQPFQLKDLWTNKRVMVHRRAHHWILSTNEVTSWQQYGFLLLTVHSDQIQTTQNRNPRVNSAD
jgi:glycosidase